MMPANGQLSVPPGFRFHPTDEELLYYYLRKKVSFEAIDLDVIREVDLNKLEPWDLKDKCRIGSGPQNEWYFFSHKDKKYPTGTRTNRATTAGFWKATGRDKSIHLTSNSKRIGMRKTLVFYTGRAPHGQKTDWIMHEYRLDGDNSEVQEDGWVVCRVFKKKNHNRPGFQADVGQEEHFSHIKSTIASSSQVEALRQNHLQALYDNYPCDGTMHLPQLFSPESVVPPSFISPVSLTSLDMECSQSLLRLTPIQQQQQQQQQPQPQPQPQLQPQPQPQPERFSGDWSFLDKLLASHHPSMGHQSQISKVNQVVDLGTSAQKFQFQCLGFETDILKFSK